MSPLAWLLPCPLALAYWLVVSKHRSGIAVLKNHGGELCAHGCLKKSLPYLLLAGASQLPCRVERLVFERGVQILALPQGLKITRKNSSPTHFGLLPDREEPDEVIDAEWRHRRHAAYPVRRKKATEGSFRASRVALIVRNKDQFELAERGKQRLVLFQVTLEAGGRYLAFIEEDETGNAGVRDQDGKPIGEVHQASGVAPR